jgi:hypothetical protein
MTYEWFSTALIKMWEGFWYTLGAGLALGVFVSFFVNYIRRIFAHGKNKLVNGWLGSLVTKLYEIVQENKHGGKRKERTLRSKKKIV